MYQVSNDVDVSQRKILQIVCGVLGDDLLEPGLAAGCVNGELESDVRVLHSEGPEVCGLQGAESKMLMRPSS